MGLKDRRIVDRRRSSSRNSRFRHSPYVVATRAHFGILAAGVRAIAYLIYAMRASGRDPCRLVFGFIPTVAPLPTGREENMRKTADDLESLAARTCGNAGHRLKQLYSDFTELCNAR